MKAWFARVIISKKIVWQPFHGFDWQIWHHLMEFLIIGHTRPHSWTVAMGFLSSIASIYWFKDQPIFKAWFHLQFKMWSVNKLDFWSTKTALCVIKIQQAWFDVTAWRGVSIQWREFLSHNEIFTKPGYQKESVYLSKGYAFNLGQLMQYLLLILPDNF